MNFLAHQFLSFEIKPIMVGNFIADTVKGNALKNYDVPIQKGIVLHRFIDSFTDSHEITLQSRERLYAHFGKYAGVVQDVFYDHFLAINWSDYHDQDLNDYTDFIYLTLGGYRSVFNERAERTFQYMQMQDWLGNYATQEGIHRALTGLSRRASFPSNMEESLPALAKHGEAISNDFKIFFPDLISATQLKLEELNS
ncbi:acyl carrier protein phosphodiesterase [Cryomorphaceae bacterium 1068]|nr:acyl carrier protein phosphodiesterase [Cryomorphaceae bacterium 1068]